MTQLLSDEYDCLCDLTAMFSWIASSRMNTCSAAANVVASYCIWNSLRDEHMPMLPQNSVELARFWNRAIVYSKRIVLSSSCLLSHRDSVGSVRDPALNRY